MTNPSWLAFEPRNHWLTGRPFSIVVVLRSDGRENADTSSSRALRIQPA
jgi:hypothetical protein